MCSYVPYVVYKSYVFLCPLCGLKTSCVLMSLMWFIKLMCSYVPYVV